MNVIDIRRKHRERMPEQAKKLLTRIRKNRENNRFGTINIIPQLDYDLFNKWVKDRPRDVLFSDIPVSEVPIRKLKTIQKFVGFENVIMKIDGQTCHSSAWPTVFHFVKQDVYVVTDGNHRSCQHRLMRKETMLARVMQVFTQ